MIFEYDNYRSYLKAELAGRAAKNKAYSLRAFAKKLGLSSSFLSEVIQSKKTLSGDSASKIAIQLNLDEKEARYFCLLAQLENEKDPVYKETIQRQLKVINPKRKISDLSGDIFRTIADWYHFAILELTSLNSFDLTPTNAAKKLGITRAEAEAAMDRLMRLELLKRNQNGKFKKTKENVLFESASPSAALKLYHKQLLDRAREAIDSQKPDRRMSSSDIVAIDPKYIEEVKKLSDRFTSDLFRLSEKSKRKDKVYCLAVHFFDLAKNGE